jgi:hypothetical protein
MRAFQGIWAERPQETLNAALYTAFHETIMRRFRAFKTLSNVFNKTPIRNIVSDVERNKTAARAEPNFGQVCAPNAYHKYQL